MSCIIKMALQPHTRGVPFMDNTPGDNNIGKECRLSLILRVS